MAAGAVRAVPGADPRHIAFLTRFRDDLANRDWADFAALWRDDAVYGDQRAGLRSEVIGGAEAARVIQTSFGTRTGFDYDINIIATRGGRGVYEGLAFGTGDELGGPWEAERLVSYELDDDDRLIWGVLHDFAERDRLVAELED